MKLIFDSYAYKQKRNRQKYEIFMNKVFAYETCDKKHGDKCPQHHCRYSVMTLDGATSTINFTCGRLLNENKL